MSICDQGESMPVTATASSTSLLEFDFVSKTLKWVAITMFALAVLQRPVVSDVATNNPTNYNVVTTLLGALTGAVNAANDNQNKIGAAVNVLLSIARERGDIAP